MSFLPSESGTFDDDYKVEVESAFSSGLSFGDEDSILSVSAPKPAKKSRKAQASEPVDELDDDSIAHDDADLETADADEEQSMKSVGSKRRRWYIVHTYSGHENKVKLNLERRIESMEMGHKIFRVEVPQKPVTKIKDGKRIEKDENLFPGYVLVEMLMDDDSWYCVRYTPGITKFIGGEKKPLPMRDAEVKRILFRGQQTVAPKIEVDLKVGEHIQIISGPFQDFEGTVTEVNAEKGKLQASVSIFGRETPVELVFSQVKKK